MQSLVDNLMSPLKKLIANNIKAQLSKYIAGIDLEEVRDAHDNAPLHSPPTLPPSLARFLVTGTAGWR